MLFKRKNETIQEWWLTSVTSEFGRVRQEHCDLQVRLDYKAILGHIVKPFLQNQINKLTVVTFFCILPKSVERDFH